MNETPSLMKLESQASFGIFGTGLDLNAISARLQIEPSHSHHKGEPGLTSRAYPQDLWLLESPLSRLEPLEAHLRWLREKLKPHYHFLRGLPEEHELRSYCGITASSYRCDFRISSEALKIFVDLGIALNLSVVFIGDSERESVSQGEELTSAQTGAQASFEAVGQLSDVTEIAMKLKHLASYGSQTGQTHAVARARQPSFWALTAPEVHDGGLDSRLIWLASELSPYASFLRSFMGRAALLVRCALRTEVDISDQSFSPEGLSFLVAVGIPLECGIFFMPADCCP